ncbi:hypothetical protein R1sor_025285 [Riccia sorocarpa]|uniref:SKP1 component POZ domain-containing protein n=1 Tax=Riccia sorocarpa TaxID=122646 RepID=A0ABD3GAY9_9MARC
MSNNRVKLRSTDDEVFEVDEAVAYESHTVKSMIEDAGTENPILLLNVSGKILSKVIEYSKYHLEISKSSDDKAANLEDEIKLWDAEFVKVEQATLFELVLAANYLKIKSLLDLTCNTVAKLIAGMTPEEIRKKSNIKNAVKAEEDGVGRENHRVQLRSTDDEVFEVDEVVAYKSQRVRNMIKDSGTENPIPLNVSSEILYKVLTWYCEYHVENDKCSDEKPATPEDEIKLWDADFMKVDPATLSDLVEAASYLQIRGLRELTCHTLDDTIKTMTPDEIQKTFGRKNKSTPEDEEVKRENQGAFEEIHPYHASQSSALFQLLPTIRFQEGIRHTEKLDLLPPYVLQTAQANPQVGLPTVNYPGSDSNLRFDPSF